MLLSNRRKFHLRLYVVVNWHPLQVFLFRNGLTLFASEIYEPDETDDEEGNVLSSRRTMHLTNSAVNMKAYRHNDDDDGDDDDDDKEMDKEEDVVTMWSVSKLEQELGKTRFDSIWSEIQDATMQLFCNWDTSRTDPERAKRDLSTVNLFVDAVSPLQRNCFDLYGLDVIIREDDVCYYSFFSFCFIVREIVGGFSLLRAQVFAFISLITPCFLLNKFNSQVPLIMELNKMPSLAVKSDVHREVKTGLMKDLVNVVVNPILNARDAISGGASKIPKTFQNRLDNYLDLKHGSAGMLEERGRERERDLPIHYVLVHFSSTFTHTQHIKHFLPFFLLLFRDGHAERDEFTSTLDGR